MTGDFEQQVAEHGARLAYESVVAGVEGRTEEEPRLADLIAQRDAEKCIGCRAILTRDIAELQGRKSDEPSSGGAATLRAGEPMSAKRQQIEALRRQVKALRDVNESLAASVGAAHQAHDAVREEVAALRLELDAFSLVCSQYGRSQVAAVAEEENRLAHAVYNGDKAITARLDRIASAVQEERR